MTLTGLPLGLIRIGIGVPLLFAIYSAIFFNIEVVTGGAVSYPRFAGWNIGLLCFLSVGVLVYGVRAIGRTDPLKLSILLLAWAGLNLAAPIIQLVGGFTLFEGWLYLFAVYAVETLWAGGQWPATQTNVVMMALGMGTVLAIGPVLLGMALLVKVREFATPDERVKKVDRTKEARWASPKEISEAMGLTGLVIGEQFDPRQRCNRFDPTDPKTWRPQGTKPLIHFDVTRGNGHVLAFSSSGTFKTSGLVIPNALTWRDPMIVIDPKGEIYDETAAVRRSMGRKPVRINAQNGLDPFALLAHITKDDPSLYTQLASFMFSPKGEQRSVDEFFEAHSNKLATALLAYFQGKRLRISRVPCMS